MIRRQLLNALSILMTVTWSTSLPAQAMELTGGVEGQEFRITPDKGKSAQAPSPQLQEQTAKTDSLRITRQPLEGKAIDLVGKAIDTEQFTPFTPMKTEVPHADNTG